VKLTRRKSFIPVGHRLMQIASSWEKIVPTRLSKEAVSRFDPLWSFEPTTIPTHSHTLSLRLPRIVLISEGFDLQGTPGLLIDKIRLKVVLDEPARRQFAFAIGHYCRAVQVCPARAPCA
jgi:hypothetical protein